MPNKLSQNPKDFQIREKIRDHVWIEINLSNLRHNLETIRREVGPDVKIMGVVKANAYGHGIREVAGFLSDKIDFLAVASLKEALWVRESGVKTPILIFGFIFPEEVDDCIEKNISVTLSSLEQAKSLSKRAQSIGKSLKAHVKVDTGMGRMGIQAGVAVTEIIEISKLRNLILEGLMTHFPVADDPKNPFTIEQIQMFKKIVYALESCGIKFSIKHAANSAGIFEFKESHFDLVRMGLALYGIYNSKLRPVLSLKAKVHLVKKLPQDHTVSYGRNFRLPKEGYVAVLPIGYGHGYPYNLAGKSRVLIRGKSYPICGNICMDYIMAYLGDRTDIETGDEAVLIGAQGNDVITVNELAQKSGTIPYEIVTQLSHALERWYDE